MNINKKEELRKKLLDIRFNNPYVISIIDRSGSSCPACVKKKLEHIYNKKGKGNTNANT